MNTKSKISNDNKFVNGMGLLSIFISHLYLFPYFLIFSSILFSYVGSLDAMFGIGGTLGRIIFSLFFVAPGIVSGIVIGKKYNKILLGMEIGLICSLVFATLYVFSQIRDPNFELFIIIVVANSMTIGCSLIIRKFVRIISSWIYQKLYH